MAKEKVELEGFIEYNVCFIISLKQIAVTSRGLHIYSITISKNIYEKILLAKGYLSHDFFLEEKVQICKSI